MEIIRSTSAKAVIPKLDAIFARQGIPDELKSDNGPSFQGYEIKNFARYLEFHHRKVQPVWPRRNGEAEGFMPNLEKCVLKLLSLRIRTGNRNFTNLSNSNARHLTQPHMCRHLKHLMAEN